MEVIILAILVLVGCAFLMYSFFCNKWIVPLIAFILFVGASFGANNIEQTTCERTPDFNQTCASNTSILNATLTTISSQCSNVYGGNWSSCITTTKESVELVYPMIAMSLLSIIIFALKIVSDIGTDNAAKKPEDR